MHNNSQKSIEKLIKFEDAANDLDSSKSFSNQMLQTNMFRTTSLKREMDTMTKTLEKGKEIPSNQQEGSAYDQELKFSKEEKKIEEFEESKGDIDLIDDEEIARMEATIKPFNSLKKKQSSK